MHVSSAILWAFVDELERRGIPRASFFSTARVDPERLRTPGLAVSVEEYRRLTMLAIELSEDPALALHVAEHAPMSALQLVGHLLATCNNVRQAFDCFLRFAGLVVEGTQFSLVEENEEARFGVKLAVGGPTHIQRPVVELILALAHRVGRSCAGASIQLREARFAYAAPAYVDEYARVFGPSLAFCRTEHALVFDRDILEMPNRYADPTLRDVLFDQAERQLRTRLQHPDAVPERVSKLLSSQPDLVSEGLPGVARALNMSPRSLRRHLKRHETSYSQLVDATRRRIVLRSLGDATLSIKEVAERAGFSESSAFHRAFKRWTGMTPKQFRASAHD